LRPFVLVRMHDVNDDNENHSCCSNSKRLEEFFHSEQGGGEGGGGRRGQITRRIFTIRRRIDKGRGGRGVIDIKLVEVWDCVKKACQKGFHMSFFLLVILGFLLLLLFLLLSVLPSQAQEPIFLRGELNNSNEFEKGTERKRKKERQRKKQNDGGVKAK